MTSTTKLFLNGFNGKMGQAITRMAHTSPKYEVVGGSALNEIATCQGETYKPSSSDLIDLINEADVLVDFSSAAGNASLFKTLKSNPPKKAKIMIGSTGLSQQQLDDWHKFANETNTPILIAPNTSLGVLLTLKTSLQIAKELHGLDFDIEIIESHHRNKIDSPSGTAMFLGKNISNQENLKIQSNRTGKREDSELGIVALRGGSVFGEHTVRFMGESEEIEITHRALSRDLFAKGALSLASWIKRQSESRVYQLTEVDL